MDTPTPTDQVTFSNTVIVGDIPVKVTLADNNQKRAQGLSILSSLPENHGMLFIFLENSRPHFWMKNMNFAIDIIWIDDWKIVQIDANAMPPKTQTQDSDLELYTPINPVDYVLEVNAGFTQEHNIMVGDTVAFP